MVEWRLARETEYSEKTCPSTILSTTNPTWLDPVLNPGRRGGKPATNRLSYGAACVHLVRRPLFGLLYNPQMIDDDDDSGAIGGMQIGKGNRSTRRRPAPVPLCPSQIPHDVTRARTLAAAVGSRWITAWAMARPLLPQLFCKLDVRDIGYENRGWVELVEVRVQWQAFVFWRCWTFQIPVREVSSVVPLDWNRSWFGQQSLCFHKFACIRARIVECILFFQLMILMDHDSNYILSWCC
jgi:hypothetical protein